MKAIEADSICFGYDPDTHVLDNLSFSVEEGSINAILGSNGCGKTTLLDCLIGFNRLQNGTISVFGKDIRETSPREFAELVSYVPRTLRSIWTTGSLSSYCSGVHVISYSGNPPARMMSRR